MSTTDLKNLEFENVYFQLRHDTAANWEAENPVLLEGEIGVELAYKTVDGVEIPDPINNKFKIGVAEELAWNDLAYTYNVNEILALIPKGCTVYKKASAEVSATAHEAKLAEITSPENGDICIITTTITETGSGNSNSVEFQKSAYIYDGANSQWVAIDGNVDASKVIIGKDFKLAGSYTRIGNITKTSTSSTADYKSKGMSVQSFLEAMVSQREQPGNPTQPSVSIKLTNNGTEITDKNKENWEVGSTFKPSFTVSFSKGSYTYGPATGVTATYVVSESDTGDADQKETSTATSGSFADFKISDTTAYKVSVTATHTAGVVAHDNLGSDSNPVKQISAGTKSGSSYTVKGYRPYFIYYGTDATKAAAAVDKEFIMKNGTKSKAPTTSISLSEGTKRVVIACPAGKTVTKVYDATAYQTVTQNFVHSTVSVGGADATSSNSYTSDFDMNYNVYTFTNVNGIKAATYTITYA